jgi:predicted N-formylglutamate amidohydrolase
MTVATESGIGGARPPLMRVHEGDAHSPYVLVCEHASAFVPPEYAGLGLDSRTLATHIGWDINAARVTRDVARLLGATWVTAGVSRLVVDLNRPESCPQCIPARSEDTVIPGNQDLAADLREQRLREWFRPFHARLDALLEDRQRAGRPTFLVGIHSYTPVYQGVSRPWAAGILFREARSFGQDVVQALRRETGAAIGANEPYDLGRHSNYTIPFHGDRRHLPAIIVEVRNDLIGRDADVTYWAQAVARALRTASEGGTGASAPLPA